jgi:predicted Zn-dependent peptidase
VQHWKQCFSAGRMSVAVAGAVEPERVFDALQKNFDGFTNGGSDERQRPMFDLQFSPERQHFNKELEQEQIAICYPGAAITDEDYAVQRVTIGVLSGGMSGRLFTEVREKQGLVYWVGAWGDYPRSAGLVHLGASTTPVHVEKTYHTLLKEIDRLADDLTDEEINRAITGIVTRARTRGDVSRSKAMELGNDLFYHGRPIPMEEKLDRVKAVDINAIRNYLKNHPRDQLSIVTLGPRELSL